MTIAIWQPCLQVGLVAVLAETGHLARGRHLHAQLDVGTCGHTSVSVSGIEYEILNTRFLQGAPCDRGMDYVDLELKVVFFLYVEPTLWGNF